MSFPSGLETGWVHPHAFASYETNRAIVAPALSAAVQAALEFIPPSDSIFEIGAGGGALRRYAGVSAGTHDWTESDHNPEFLALPRHTKVTSVQAVLPNIPAEPGSLDAIVGMGVLDTLATPTLAATFEAMARALRDGGKVLHIMDLAPDLEAEIYNARPEGLFPLPFSANQRVGISYTRTDGIKARLAEAGVSSPLVNVIASIAERPDLHLAKATGTPLLNHLGNTVVEAGVAEFWAPDWMVHYGNRLGLLAERAGLAVVFNDYIERTASQKRSRLPKDMQTAIGITRKYGVTQPEHSSPPFKGSVPVTANVHVFAAIK